MYKSKRDTRREVYDFGSSKARKEIAMLATKKKKNSRRLLIMLEEEERDEFIIVIIICMRYHEN